MMTTQPADGSNPSPNRPNNARKLQVVTTSMPVHRRLRGACSKFEAVCAHTRVWKIPVNLISVLNMARDYRELWSD